MRSGHDADRTEDPGRILDRVARESDAGTLASGAGLANRPGVDRAGGQDAVDPVENWGVRIGKMLGFLLTIGFGLWFVSYILRGL